MFDHTIHVFLRNISCFQESYNFSASTDFCMACNSTTIEGPIKICLR